MSEKKQSVSEVLSIAERDAIIELVRQLAWNQLEWLEEGSRGSRRVLECLGRVDELQRARKG